ncbi:MAG: putative sulfate exporter family transporter [Archaeoglobaceae archaeon]
MWESIRLIDPGRLRTLVNQRQIEFVTLLTVLTIGVVSFVISRANPAFSPLFNALILGIVLGYFVEQETKEVAKRLIGVMLPISVALYGFNMSMEPPKITGKILAAELLVVFTIFCSVYSASRFLRLGQKMSVLLSCGAGICGVSAIAIVAPIIKPRREEFSAAIIVITVVGLTAALIYTSMFKLGIVEKLAFLAGSTLPHTGLVKIATSPFGAEVESTAMAIKAVRIAMIAVVALILSLFYTEKKFYVPWFVMAFVATALIGSYLGEVASPLKNLSTILFASTLALIGTTVEVDEIYRVGARPLVAAYVGWLVSFAVFIAIQGEVP